MEFILLKDSAFVNGLVFVGRDILFSKKGLSNCELSYCCLSSLST